MKKKLLIFALVLGLAFTAFVIGGTVAHALRMMTSGQAKVSKPDPKRDGTYRLKTVSKKARVNSLPSRAHVTIHLLRLSPADLVNIRPVAGAEIKVAAGLMRRKDAESPHAEDSLPESAMNVSASEIVFSRPASAEGDVILDVQLPRGASVRVLTDGDEVAFLSLHEPAAIRDGKVEPGAPSLAAAMIQSAMSRDLAGIPPLRDEQSLGSGGARFVPFEKLQVLKTVDVDLGHPRNRATLEINADGEVVRVITAGGKRANPGVEESLKQWRFAPYLVDGQPVPVVTVVPSVQGK